jgi:hypothetical protein
MWRDTEESVRHETLLALFLGAASVKGKTKERSHHDGLASQRKTPLAIWFNPRHVTVMRGGRLLALPAFPALSPHR